MATRRTTLLGVAGVATAVAVGAPPALASSAAAGHRRRPVLFYGGHVLTGDPQAGELPGGELLVDGGRVAAVGYDLDRRGAQLVDARGMIVAPGLVDNHRHLWGALLRGLNADDTFGEYLNGVLLGALPGFTPGDVYLGGLVGALEALDSGVTAVLDWNHACPTRAHARAAVDALADSGIRGRFGYASPGHLRGADAPPTAADVEAAAGYLADHGDGRLGLAVATRSPASFGRDPAGVARAVADIRLARQLAVPASMHIGFDTDADMQLLDRQVGLGPDLSLPHPNTLTAAGLGLLASTGAWPSISPEVELQMEFPPAQLRAVLDAGLLPTVSLDGPSIIAGHLQTQLRMLVQVQRMLDRVQAGPPAVLAPPTLADTLPYVTSYAARSIGLDVGVLAAGRPADVVLVDRSDPSLAGADPATAYAALTHPGAVDTVMVAGRVVKRGGRLLGHDLDGLRRKVDQARARLAG